MFGVSRNKKKPLANKAIRTTASSSDDDDDDNDEEHRRRNLGKKRDKKSNKMKKMKIGSSKSSSSSAAAAAVGLSFDPEEDHDGAGGLLDFTSSSPSKKRKKKHSKKSSKKSKRSSSSGFGYGGGMVFASDESASDDVEQNQDQTNNTSSQYDVAALQQLKMEQSHGKKIVADDLKTNERDEHQGEANNEQKSHDEMEEEFIPLSTTQKRSRQHDPIVLTGDEALAFAEKEEEGDNYDPTEFDHGLKEQPKQTKPEEATEVNEQIEEEVEEGNRQWEDTMARRAGVLPSSGTSQRSDTLHRDRKKVKSDSSSIAEIKGSLQPTINNLENVSSDLATSMHRQESTIVSTKDELTKLQSTLQEHGKALEYYQGLREDVATWMGALRELDSMVSLAEEARRRWEVDVTWKKLDRFFEWGEDCTSVLEKKGLLESKLFTCNDNSEADQAPEVDEFGRVVSSKATMARMKRLDRRRKMQSQRLNNVDNGSISACINEDNFDIIEIDEWEQRHKALNDAVALIPNSVNEDYRSVANLCTLFHEWQRLYPGDYKTSFAEMSLVKMASVLVRLELCQRWDLLGLSRSNDDESQLRVNEILELRFFQSCKTINGTSFMRGVLLQIIQNDIVALLLRSFSFDDEVEGGESIESLHGVYNPFSADQTKHLCTSLRSILGYISTEETNEDCEKTIESVSGALLSLVRKCIGRMTIPIINASNFKREGNSFVTKDDAVEFDDETNDAISYAMVAQAQALCTLVTNMLQFWYPIISEKADDLVKFNFTDIVSLRILPVIQAMQSNNFDLAKTLIGEVVSAASGLLDKKEWMLQAAPLRVAAQTMGLSSDNITKS